MDIAKIRKKFQQSEQEKAKGDQKELRPTEKKSEAPRKLRDDQKSSQDHAPSGLEEPAEVGKDVESKKIKTVQPGQKEQNAGATSLSPASENQVEEICEILTFRLMKEEFAFHIVHLNEILRLQRITKVPKMPHFVLGITSLRGKIIPVIDLKQKLSLSSRSTDFDQKSKILIIRGPLGAVGAIVDRVIGVIRIAKNDILPPPSHLSDIELKFIEGVAVIDKRFISIINMKETVSVEVDN